MDRTKFLKARRLEAEELLKMPGAWVAATAEPIVESRAVRLARERTNMRRDSDFLEVAAQICAVITAVLAVADWVRKVL